MAPYVCRATQTLPRWDLVRRCQTVAVDVEFQRVLYSGAAKWTQRIGRIALKWSRCQQGDESKRFGVVWKDLESKNGAVPAAVVEQNCRRIFEGRTVVMHASQGDMHSFRIEVNAFTKSTIVDTQSLYHGPMGLRHSPSLADCSADYLGQIIQTGLHSPVEDAAATMQLYLLRKAGNYHAQLARLKQQRIEAYEAGLGGTLDTSEHTRPDASTLTYSDVLARDMAIARIVLRLQITIDEARRRETLDPTPNKDGLESTDVVDVMISATEDHMNDDIESLGDFDDVESEEHEFYS